MKKLNLLILLFIGLNAMVFAGNTDNEITLKEKATALLQQQPVKFIENLGQMTDVDGKPIPEVLFKAEAPGVNVWITETGITLQTFTIRKEPLTGKELEEWEAAGGFIRTERGGEQSRQEKTKKFFDWERIDMELKGANIQKENIHKEGASTTDFNFFYGHCPDGIYGVKEYDKITIKEVYPGIDWVLYSSPSPFWGAGGGGFKYDFVVHPQADYNQIELIYHSKTTININQQGQLAFTTDYGNLIENKPVSFYENQEVTTKFKQNYQHATEINGDKGYETSISFHFSSDFRPRTSDLIIDPQLVWATFYGSAGTEAFMDIATDPFGNVFVVGGTTSATFPTLNSGTYFQGYGGNGDAVILKFSNAGVLLWSTFYGGIGSDYIGNGGYSIAADCSGNVFVGGYVGNPGGLPVFNPGGGVYYQGTYAGAGDAFILKFDNLGNRLWATYYGGSNQDMGVWDMITDGFGNLYITGQTFSVDFPVLNPGGGAFFQPTLSGFRDAYITKFSNTGVQLWSTYYGGQSITTGFGISVDLSGNIFVTGYTNHSNLLTLVDPGGGAYFKATTTAGQMTAFVLKFNNTDSLVWATLYGGTATSVSTQGVSIATDPIGNIFVTGVTTATDLPVFNPGGGAYFQPLKAGGAGKSDMFILKFNTNGIPLWGTYYGGSQDELKLTTGVALHNIAIDPISYDVYVSFPTASVDVPVQSPSCGISYYDTTANGGTLAYDNFMTKFDNDGISLWATYFGGNGKDGDLGAMSIVLDNSGNLFSAGNARESLTPLTNASYPLTNPGGGAFFDGTFNGPFTDGFSEGGNDGFLAKFLACPPSVPNPTPIVTVTPSSSTICPGGSVTLTASGMINYSWSPATGLNTTTGATVVANPSATTTYTVRGTNDCLSDTQTVTVTIGAAPSVNFSVTPGCPCNNVSFAGGGTISTWYWTFGDGDTSTLQSPTHIYAAPGSYYVTLVGSDTSGCSNSQTQVISVCGGDIAPPTSKSNNRWYFQNNAGVDFSSGSPIAVTDGQASAGSEGGATVSHPVTGNLLFYTNAINVWDTTHTIMPNGTAIGGVGTAEQGVLILPFPGDTNRYYIFTIRGNSGGFLEEVHYSVVDMTLNGGLGDVIAAQKNIFLTTSGGSEALSAVEKMPATCSNAAQYWLVVTPNTSCEIYQAFLIDSSGINTTPVTSTITVPDNTTCNQSNSIGATAFSPNGGKFARTMYDFGVSPINNRLLVLDFNKNTGTFSNLVILPNVKAYGLQFSPDNRLLYATTNSPNALLQFDITVVNPASTVTNLGNTSVTTMWTGLDGKIYFPRQSSSFLSVINNPNIFGVGAGFVNSAVPLAGKIANFGLQNIVPLNLPLQDTLIANFTFNTTNCQDVDFTNTSAPNLNPNVCSFYNTDTLTYLWNFDDGSPISTIENPSHTYAAPGNYDVELVISRPRTCNSDTIIQTVVILAPSNSIDIQTACNSFLWIDGNNYVATTNTPTFTIVGGAANGCDSVVTLDLTINTFVSSTDVQTACNSYTWIDGNNYVATTNAPTFTIVGGAANGCDSVVTLDLTINTFVSSTDVQTACNSYTWIDGNNYIASTNTPTFTIVGGAANGCDSVVTLDLTINTFVSSTDVQTACNSYTWIDGNNYTTSTNTPTFTIVGGAANGCDSVVTLDLTITVPVTTTNVYNECEGFSVTVGTNTYTTTGIFTNIINNCDTVVTNLTINPAPQLTLIKADDNCGEQIGSVAAVAFTTNPPIVYNWNTGSTDATISNLPAGTYSVIVNDGSGCTKAETIDVAELQIDCDFFVYTPNMFSPNGDGQNDVFFVRGKGIEALSVKIYNRWGNKVFEINDVTQGWDGKYKGSEQNTSVFVFVLEATFLNGKTVTQSGDVSLIR